MPNPRLAPRELWVPFLVEECGVDSNTVVIGHSSGAVCAMRLAEEYDVAGIVLVAACHTDLGVRNEAEAHYYPPSETSKLHGTGDGGEWDFDAMRRHAKFIIQFHSTDDCFIPIEEARFIAEKLDLGSDYHEFIDKNHFFEPFDELEEVLREKSA